MLTNLDHHQLLIFWMQILALYATARLLGSLARKIGLPAVIGELSAGVLWGPSFFKVVWADGFNSFLPTAPTIAEARQSAEGFEAFVVSHEQSAMLLAVSWFCAAFLLVVAGFETDLGLIQRLGKAAISVSIGSIVLPLAGGLAAGYLMPKVFYGELDGESPSQLVFALFIATSVAVSALAVVAKILGDLKLMRRDVGQITIAVGMANDLVGWVILGVIAGLAASGELSAGDALFTVFGLGMFLVLALTAGQRLVDAALRSVRRDGRNVRGALTVTIGTMLLFGVVTQALGVEAVLGAFVAGVVIARSRYQQIESEHTIEDLTDVVFAPLFFATAGLRLDLSLIRGEALYWSLILLAVALGLKFAGSFLGAKFSGLTTREGFVLGAGLNARGALEIIIATVGLSLGVFNQTTFTMIAMIPLVTSVFASIGLRLFSRDLEGSVAERERLAHEEALDRNLLIRNNRILLPFVDDHNSIVAAQIVHFAWPENLAATVVPVASKGEEPNLSVLRDVLYGRELDVRPLVKSTGSEIAQEVLAQANLGYGVIAVGAEAGSGNFISPVVEDLLRTADLPVVIVRKAMNHPGRLPGIFAQALVPVVASSSSRAAQELAANLSSNLGTKLMLSHVVYREPAQSEVGRLFGRFRATAFPADKGTAERVLAQAHAHALEVRADADTEIRFASSPAVEIVRHGAEIEADLIVVGAQLRRLDDGRPSLGPNVEHVLEHAPQTVVVVAMPDDRPD